MVLLLTFLLVVILFGIGFAIHLLWWIAIAAAVLWLLGFFFGRGQRASGRRWTSRW